MSASIVDNDHLMLWQQGRPVRAETLGPWTGERTLEIQQKVLEGILDRELLSAVPCPTCKATMSLVRQGTLLCEKCATSVDTNKIFRPEFYQYSASPRYTQSRVLGALRGAGFTVGPVLAAFPPITGGVPVCTLRSQEGGELDLVLASQRVKGETLYQLWGFAKVHSRKVVLVHPGLAKAAEQLLELAGEVSPVFSLEFPRLGDPASVGQVALFPRYRDRVTELLADISRRLEGGSSDASPPDLFGITDVQLEELSRTGGERYQLPALKMLMALGPTAPFTKAGWVPDGVLLDPNGFWIVDPKSSESGFAFSVPERDKMERYLDTIARHQHLFGPSLEFRGEILITRTDPIPVEAIHKAGDYLRARAVGNVVSLVSHEGLRWLMGQIQKDPSFWHLRDSVHDPVSLLKLDARAFKDGAIPEPYRQFVDAPVRLIGLEVFKAHYEFVMSRGVYSAMGARSPGSIAELAQGVYVQSFARPPKRSREEVRTHSTARAAR